MTINAIILNRLFRYCFALCGNRADAQDLVQDSIEKYIRQPNDSVNEINAYLRQVARNRFYDGYRRKVSVSFESLDEPDFIISAERDLEALLVDEQILIMVWEKLSSDEREVIFLWSVEGYSASEIALNLGLSRNTVLSRMRRVKLRFHGELDKLTGEK
ncbi:MAG: RNA polymerase sigma factor [Gammaproteobacteria bacterium]|nr:RNA polymerase sigma factor [Gammaproteobacteria bacterium]